jgi:hypothetical protein
MLHWSIFLIENSQASQHQDEKPKSIRAFDSKPKCNHPEITSASPEEIIKMYRKFSVLHPAYMTR